MDMTDGTMKVLLDAYGQVDDLEFSPDGELISIHGLDEPYPSTRLEWCSSSRI
jgi:hypothetical protein